ncbi:MAG: ATP-dependent DNA helicase [Bilifractor sp.]|jgi:DNA excision repair protein ERCC-2
MKQQSKETRTTEQPSSSAPEKKVLRISVRNLVEFLLRSGDLQGAREGFADRDAMQEGSRIHRSQQKRRGSGYQAEVSLSCEKEYENFTLIVEGRADGIYHGRGWAVFSKAEFCGRENDASGCGAAFPKSGSTPASDASEGSSVSAAAAQNGETLTTEPRQNETASAAVSGRRRKPRAGSGEITVIEEIKGISQDPSHLGGPVPVHLAQAKCYAYLYALRHPEIFPLNRDTASPSLIYVCMSYVRLETEKLRQFLFEYTVRELADWFQDLLAGYYKWADFQVSWEEERNRSIHGLEFPYAYRPGQRELAADIYRTIIRKKELFVQAPTGIGKTISAIFPAVHALGEHLADKIFYLTAKTITRTVAEEAFCRLQGQGLRIKAVTLTAKEKICVLDEPDCRPEICPRANGHFGRVNDALFEMLTDGTEYSRTAIERQAEKWSVCPHEFQLDLALFADAIICDYNYAFDPNARLKRFFGEGTRKGEYLFLIDEAHNLVERGREMFSAELFLNDFRNIRREWKRYAETLPSESAGTDNSGDLPMKLDRAARSLSACIRTLLKYRKSCENPQILSLPGDLVSQLMNLSGRLEDLLADLREDGPRKDTLEFYFQISSFLNISDLADDSYLIYDEITPGNDLHLKLFCVNPSSNLQRCLDRGRSAVFFSATMIPVNYYRSLLTTKEDTYAVYIPSPFDRRRRLILAGSDVSSRYRRRGHDEYVRIASYIRIITEKKAGNYMVFFPSYQMMSDVRDIYLTAFAGIDGESVSDGTSGAITAKAVSAGNTCSDNPGSAGRNSDNPDSAGNNSDKPGSAGHTGRGDEGAGRSGVCCISQTPQMSELEREEFLEKFAEPRSGTLIGFCVLGGIFSEGIDLTGEQLIGTIIVGTGLPQVGTEREFLRQYYDHKNAGDPCGNGFDIAYRYPGMNKVLQAAGRVIRTTSDCGIIALLDDRFLNADYRRLFPREWNDIQRVSLKTAGETVEAFWHSVNKS